MNDKIRVLPDRVANLIAAGEVVQNPSSVVKEMMENSIDAGASEVIVNFRNGGSDLIQIVDNGAGMSPTDARMAFEKHATSKITVPDDLYALSTFGFRGEALASIASVAQVELRTRNAEHNVGTVTTINGGRFVDQQTTMCDVGSNFFVRNLFYNIPARKKFIDNSKRCTNQIKSEFKRVALCYPEVSFELYEADMPIYKLPKSNLVGRIVDIVGRTIKRNLLEIEAETTIVKVQGYIGRPESAKRGGAEQYLFVNGRYFKSPYIHSAIAKGYEKIINPQLNPSYFLYLEVDPNRIDVNIHPQKTEVKFSDRELIWQIIHAAVRESLAKSGSVPMMDFDSEERVEIPVMQQGTSYDEPRAMVNSNYNPFSVENEQVIEVSQKWSPTPLPSSRRTSGGGSNRVLKDYGTLRNDEHIEEWESGLIETPAVEIEEIEIASNTNIDRVADSSWSDIEMGSTLVFDEPEEQMYEQGELIASNSAAASTSEMIVIGGHAWLRKGSSMLVIDLRRGVESLMYNHFLKQLTSHEPVSQGLLFPIELQLSSVEYDRLLEHMDDLHSAGFDIDLSSDHTIFIRSLPVNISGKSVDALLYELLQLFDTPQNMEEYRRREMATILARSAVGQPKGYYDRQEATKIVEQLLAEEQMPRTPSGKSVALEISTEEVRKRMNS